MNPDATGLYDEAGVHNGKPYYRRHDGAYFIWRDGIDFFWILSIGLDNLIPSWTRGDPAVVGDYAPGGGWTGIATVTAH